MRDWSGIHHHSIPAVNLTYVKGDDLAEAERWRERALAAEAEITWKQVYERYRRRRARDSRITLREVCEEMGVDYDNTRAAKYRATKRKKDADKRHKQTKK